MGLYIECIELKTLKKDKKPRGTFDFKKTQKEQWFYIPLLTSVEKLMGAIISYFYDTRYKIPDLKTKTFLYLYCGQIRKILALKRIRKPSSNQSLAFVTLRKIDFAIENRNEIILCDEVCHLSESKVEVAWKILRNVFNLFMWKIFQWRTFFCLDL